MRLLLFVISAACASSAFAQSKVTYSGFPSTVWPKLYDITYQKTADDPYANPQFSKGAKELNGKIISLPGYIFPYQNNSMKSDHFMFSSLPLASCFFCGVGGPETAIEVFLKAPFIYTNKLIEVKGKFVLNTKNPDQLIYVLTEASVVGEIEL
ncbi:MAG: hypothetical protein DI538_06095 [Azospira oryzae]|jgi:hypothetical protein|nr:hypothetical protein [Cytophaga sp.]PZR39797.1 MAG: hypothetical protein DI538_06095 [Azospira oryzae]